MDNGPEQRDDDITRFDLPATRVESGGPGTDRVRIVGAEPAGEATSELPLVGADEPDVAPVVEGMADEGPGGVRLTDEPARHEAPDAVAPVEPGGTAMPAGPTTELPHWTEPATGQVPAVLARGNEDDSGADSGVIPPAWREEHADWVAHEEQFDASVLGGDHETLGSLDETDDTRTERRPWEFSLDEGSAPRPVVPTATTASDPLEPTVAASGQTGEARHVDETGVLPTVAAASVPPHDGSEAPGAHDAPLEEGDLPGQTAARPTGTQRPGRMRRNGLRPGRLRAKRPSDEDAFSEPPLAAEPPGASVTDVPGAGRKRVGLSGLAAADRSAELDRDLTSAGRIDDTETDDGAGSSAEVLVAAAAVVAPARTFGLRGPRRRSPERAGGSEWATGGGPPAPRRTRSAPGSARSSGRAPTSGLAVRIGTGLAVAAVALVAFKLGTVTSVALTVVVVTFAAGECFGVLRRAGYHPATLLGLVGTISLMIGAYTKGVAALPLILVLITVFTLLWYLFGVERGSPVAGAAATLLTVMWVSLLGSFAGLLLAPSLFPDRHGIAFLVGAIVATVANDVGALVIGGWLGSRPLAPTISPNKTWEGFFGGAVFSVLISAVVVGSIHPWSAAHAALLGLVVAVVAPIGDLCESLLKRDLRLKDMGTLLPGHGGVLDRVDGLLFVLPATYYLVRALNIG